MILVLIELHRTNTTSCSVPVFVADQVGQAIVSAAETGTRMQPTPFTLLFQSDRVDPNLKLPVYK